MADLPDLMNPQRARLFPILADTSKEGRTLSIFLATLTFVRAFSQNLFGSIGQRIGTTTIISTYTEVNFNNLTDKKLGRPDGLIVLETGKRTWTALVEAKVGKSEISNDQLERYLEIAKSKKIDAVVTISNQFATVPDHHPVKITSTKFKGIGLYHFSWMQIMTVARLLTANQDIEDDEQANILKEFLRFISHPSAGVEGFSQMPKAWSTVCALVQAGGKLVRNDDLNSVVEAWQQETKDLSLILSRQLGTFVREKLSRAESSSPGAKFESDVKELVSKQALCINLAVPDAAAPLSVIVDLRRRSILNSMYVKAPGDKVSNKARLNWLLRQIPNQADSKAHIRMYWPGSSPSTQLPLSDLRENPDRIGEDKGKMTVVGFDVIVPVDLGNRFGQTRTIIQELETSVPHFYESVGQHIRQWSPPPPKLSQERVSPETVSPNQISENTDSIEAE